MQKAKSRKQRACCCRPHAVAGGPFENCVRLTAMRGLQNSMARS